MVPFEGTLELTQFMERTFNEMLKVTKMGILV